MLIRDLLNKDPDIVPDEDPLLILDIKSDLCMAKNDKYTKYNRHISRRVNIMRNNENINCTGLTGVKEV